MVTRVKKDSQPAVCAVKEKVSCPVKNLSNADMLAAAGKTGAVLPGPAGRPCSNAARLDRLGDLTVQRKFGSVANDLGQRSSEVIQRVIFIGDKDYRTGDDSIEVELLPLLEGHLTNLPYVFSKMEMIGVYKTVYDLVKSSVKYNFTSSKELASFLNHTYDMQMDTEHESGAQEWWEAQAGDTNEPDKTRVHEIKEDDPLFHYLAWQCIRNHETRPYPTDALHERGGVMQAWFTPAVGFWGVLKKWATLAKRTVVSVFSGSPAPDFEIIKIEILYNQNFLQDFQRASGAIEAAGRDPRETSLYAGFSVLTTDKIVTGGHRPDLGAYARLKGYGAHGSGAYFTDQPDKAMSYAGEDSAAGIAPSILSHQVLLGESFRYSKRGRFRESQHNEMVRPEDAAAVTQPGRHLGNRQKTEPTGVSVSPETRGADSLIGEKTSEPGFKMIGTLLNGAHFDSDEYMVRNADQIYAKFRIYFRRKG